MNRRAFFAWLAGLFAVKAVAPSAKDAGVSIDLIHRFDTDTSFVLSLEEFQARYLAPVARQIADNVDSDMARLSWRMRYGERLTECERRFDPARLPI